ncbi:MAG: hypothetical protein WCE64_07070 [Bacteroidales bacterium]
MVKDHKIDKLCGPSGTFAGYSFMIIGAIAAYFNPAALILVPVGIFIAFTHDGAMIDFDSRRIRAYTSYFGILKAGRWYPADSFSKFSIYRSMRRYTTYSRANIPLTVKKCDVRLALLNNTGSLKVIINKYGSFEAARNEMTDLIRNLNIVKLDEWAK